jgi:hypothetical protein
MPVISKTAFARHRKVSQGAVANYIRRRGSRRLKDMQRHPRGFDLSRSDGVCLADVDSAVALMPPHRRALPALHAVDLMRQAMGAGSSRDEAVAERYIKLVGAALGIPIDRLALALEHLHRGKIVELLDECRREVRQGQSVMRSTKGAYNRR